MSLVDKIKKRLLNKKQKSQSGQIVSARDKQNKIIEDAFGSNWSK